MSVRVLIVSCIALCASCAVGFKRTGPGWEAMISDETAESHTMVVARSGDMVTEETSFTGRILEPSNGIGLRFGINGGITYGREFGSYNGKSTYALAADRRADLVAAWSRLALIASYVQMSMDFDKPEDQLLGTEYELRIAYAPLPYLSFNAGAGLVTGTEFTRNNVASMSGSDGGRLLGGADLFIYQNWVIDVGVKLFVTVGGSTATFADGTRDHFGGTEITVQPYITLF